MLDIEFLFQSHGIVLYSTIALALLGGAIGLPIPEDVPLIIAGKLLAEQRVHPVLIFLVCYCAIVVGDVIIFSIGHLGGKALLASPRFGSKGSRKKVRRIAQLLEQHSVAMIFIARHLFYLRTFTFLTCGALKMRLSRFLLADALAALVSTTLMLGVGYVCKDYINALFDNIAQLKSATLLLLLGTILLGALIWLAQRRRSASTEPDESSL